MTLPGEAFIAAAESAAMNPSCSLFPVPDDL